MRQSHRLNINVSHEQAKDIAEAANSFNMSMSEFIRCAVFMAQKLHKSGKLDYGFHLNSPVFSRDIESEKPNGGKGGEG